MASKKKQATKLYGDIQKLKALFVQKKLAHDLGDVTNYCKMVN